MLCSSRLFLCTLALCQLLNPNQLLAQSQSAKSPQESFSELGKSVDAISRKSTNIINKYNERKVRISQQRELRNKSAGGEVEMFRHMELQKMNRRGYSSNVQNALDELNTRIMGMSQSATSVEKEKVEAGFRKLLGEISIYLSSMDPSLNSSSVQSLATKFFKEEFMSETPSQVSTQKSLGLNEYEKIQKYRRADRLINATIRNIAVQLLVSDTGKLLSRWSSSPNSKIEQSQVPLNQEVLNQGANKIQLHQNQKPIGNQ